MANDLMFPSNILNEEMAQYTVNIHTFYEKETERGGDTVFSFKKQPKNYVGTVTLPLPNNLQDTNGHLWSEYSIVESIKEFAGAAESTGNGAAQQAAGAIAGLANVASRDGALNKIARRTLGVGIDPNMRMEYTGENLRDFSMSFVLMPTSAEEAETIKNIILQLT